MTKPSIRSDFSPCTEVGDRPRWSVAVIDEGRGFAMEDLATKLASPPAAQSHCWEVAVPQKATSSASFASRCGREVGFPWECEPK